VIQSGKTVFIVQELY